MDEDTLVTVTWAFDSVGPNAPAIWEAIVKVMVVSIGEDGAKEVLHKLQAELERRKAHPNTRKRTISVKQKK